MPVQALPRSLPPSHTLASQWNPWDAPLLLIYLGFLFLLPGSMPTECSFYIQIITGILIQSIQSGFISSGFFWREHFWLVADLVGQSLVKVVWVFSEVVTKQLEQCLLWHYQRFVCAFQSDPGTAFSKLNILYLVADFKHCSLFPTECRMFITTENRSNILFWRKNKWDDVLYETNGREVITARSESQHWSQ